MNYNFENAKFNFVEQRNKLFIFSAVLILAGLAVLFMKGLNLGIDFTSGSRVEIEAEQSLSVNKVKDEFAELGLTPEQVIISGENEQRISARFKGDLNKEEIAQLNTHFKELYGNAPSVSTVSPQVGRALAKNAILAVAIASIGIILYVWIRFEFLQGLAAIVALVHDAFFIVAVFSLLQLEVNVTFIAAVLTIIGYSINDTIVTFDRVRENMKFSKRVKGFSDLSEIVNRSIYQTLPRSLNTSLTTVIAAVAILIFGSESIRNFAFALAVGLVAGTYSSIFIACQLWVVWKAKALKRQRLKPKEA